MKRTDKGSILVEAIVMIGLISALTPVLYKHVSDRRSEVEDINKANTFLLIQRETERYLKENRGNVASGLLPLSNIGLARLDSKYVIGIRKQDDDVYAMIAEKEASNGGNDMKAGKVASLIGVSAGIYSAINSANAYGINGVWIEAVSDYGLNGVLPTGSVVVTTQYNKEKQKFYSSDIDWSDGDSVTVAANTVLASRFCIGNTDNCITSWDDVEGAAAGDINMSLCFNDMNAGLGYSDFCKAIEDVLQNCQSISDYYKGRGRNATSAYYWLGSNANNLTKKSCYFVAGEMPSNKEIVAGCNTDNYEREFACAYDYQNNWLTKNCATTFAADNTLSSNFYTFATASSYTTNQPCVFKAGKAANNAAEVVTQCTAGNTAACARGWIDSRNRSCAQVVTSLGNTADRSGYYTLTTSQTGKKTDVPCYYVKSGTTYIVANQSQTITNCNSVGAGKVSCAFGYYNNYNRSCDTVRSAGKSFISKNNILMSALKTKLRTDKCYYSTCEIGATNVCSDNYTYGNAADAERNYRYCTYNGTGYSCAEGCTTNTDCGTGYYCKNLRCEPNVTSCTQLSDCAGNNDGLVYCKLSDGTCTATKCTVATSAYYCGSTYYCEPASGACYSAQQIIEGCNAAKSMTSPYCQAGWNNSLNRTCGDIKTNYSASVDWYALATSSSLVSEACCNDGSNITPAVATNLYNITSGTWSYRGVVNRGNYTISCPGVYRFMLAGEIAVESSGPKGSGGIITAEKYFPANTKFYFKSMSGFVWAGDNYGGAGMGMWVNSTDGRPDLVAGGGYSNGEPAGGLIGGNTGSRWGYSFDGTVGNNTASERDNSADGGGPYSGTGTTVEECVAKGYTCTSLIPGKTVNSSQTPPQGNNGSAYGRIQFVKKGP